MPSRSGGGTSRLLGTLPILLLVALFPLTLFARVVENDPMQAIYDRRVKELVACKDSGIPCECREPEDRPPCPDCPVETRTHRKHVLDCSWHEGSREDQLNSTILQIRKDFQPQRVDLSGNRISEFDASVFLTAEKRALVEELDLSSNTLRRLPDGAFDDFTNLRVLNLSGNLLDLDYESYRYGGGRIQPIATWASAKLGRTLEVLDLSRNAFSSIPSGFFNNLPNLKRLILDGNRPMTALMGTFELPALVELSLRACGTGRIDGEFFAGMPNLERLDLSENRFNSVPIQIHDLRNLKWLDLSRNNMWNVVALKPQHDRYGSRIRRKSPIVSLNLSGNYFGKIEYETFANYPELKHLDLSHTELYELDRNAFGVGYSTKKTGRTKLETLDLRNCRLHEIDENMLPWSQLKSLRLDANEWFCTGRGIQWLIERPELRPLWQRDGGDPKCAHPAPFRGRAWSTITREELENPTETTVFYYMRQAVDFVWRNQQISFFVLGALSALLAMCMLRCALACLKCMCRRGVRAIKSLDTYNAARMTDRTRLLEHEEGREKSPSNDPETSTIASTVTTETSTNAHE